MCFTHLFDLLIILISIQLIEIKSFFLGIFWFSFCSCCLQLTIIDFYLILDHLFNILIPALEP